ncbi:MAG: MATE family efflux transporter [Kiritimatiellaeota bacterium]|nr:MATE family efflux transporter [Kiritimatiellota bacterium]
MTRVEANASRRQTERLGTDAIAPLVMRLSLPAIIGLLVSSLYQFVDRIFIGQFVGEQGLAAMNAVQPLATLLFAFTLCVGRGGSVIYSIALGRHDYDAARRIFSRCVFTQFAAALALMTPTLIFLGPILGVCGARADAFVPAREYMSLIVLGLPFGMFLMSNHLIRSEGASTYSMISQVVGAVTNVALDYLLMSDVVGLKMGVRGAALATVASQGVSAAMVGAFFIRKSVVRFKPRECVPSLDFLKRVIANGSTPLATHLVMAVTWTVQNRMINQFAAPYTVSAAMAVFGVVMNLNHLMITPMLGLAMGMQPLVGYNHGAGKTGRVRKVFFFSVFAAVVFTLIPFGVLQIFARAIIAQFGLRGDTLTLGASTLRRYLLLMPLGGMGILFSHYFQGTGQARKALLLSLVRQLALALPFMLIIPRFFGYAGIVFAFPLSEVCGTFFAAWMVGRELRIKN